MARIRATISRSKTRVGCSDCSIEERLKPLKGLLASSPLRTLAGTAVSCRRARTLQQEPVRGFYLAPTG